MAIVNDFDPPCSDVVQASDGGLQPFRALSPRKAGFLLATVEQAEAQGTCQQSLSAALPPR